MFQVVATDLDGTLLGPDSQVDALTIRTLREVAALGASLVLATGRHYLDAARFGEALGVRAHLITANGARVHDPDGGRIFGQDLAPDVARELMSPEIAGARLVNAFVDEGWLVNRPCPELDGYFRASGLMASVRDLAAHPGEGLAKVAYMGEKRDLLRLEAQILERFDGRVCTTFAVDAFLEVMAPAVDKGRALREILRRLGAEVSACVAFGDGLNDLEMLSAAGRAFVMTGSSPELVSALKNPSFAGKNSESGVALTLRELFGLAG